MNIEYLIKFSTCSEPTPRAPILDGRMAQFMQPCRERSFVLLQKVFFLKCTAKSNHVKSF